MLDNSATAARFGSDLIVAGPRQLGIEYVAMNPGATWTGIHQSLVSRGGPELILALNENSAVSIAEGFSRLAGRPMGVAFHNLVGLQAGCMGIFNAWANQAPMLVLGESGPRDTPARRPWIDWVHTPRGQSLLVRDYVKWDDEPTSIAALMDSLVRAQMVTLTPPHGPAHVAVDVGLQDHVLEPHECTELVTAKQHNSFALADDTVNEIVSALRAAEFPVIAADFVGRSRRAYESLVRMAEALRCPVVDLGARLSFPSTHWLDGTLVAEELLERADLVLALDPRDPLMGIETSENEGSAAQAPRRNDPFQRRNVIDISLNVLRSTGFLDATASGVVGQTVIGDTAVCLDQIYEAATRSRLRLRNSQSRQDAFVRLRSKASRASDRQLDEQAGRMTTLTVCRVAWEIVREGPWIVANGEERGSTRRTWALEDWNSYLGRNVGAGLGHGGGASIGAALANDRDDEIVVNIQNDGDLLSTGSALWSLAKYNLPVLTVTLNNRTYLQDRMHQSRATALRGREFERIGQGVDIDDPAMDLALLARAQGIEAWGPVTSVGELHETLTRAANIVRSERRPVLVDAIGTIGGRRGA